MVTIYKCFIVFMIILLPTGINAATVENLDYETKRIKIHTIKLRN